MDASKIHMNVCTFQAIDMFVIVLQQCQRENEDRWKRLSRQVTDTVLPALTRQQVRGENMYQQQMLLLHFRIKKGVNPNCACYCFTDGPIELF